MRALDWFGRLVILVMSALATLSLIASLSSVSTAPLPAPTGERGPVVAGRDPPASDLPTGAVGQVERIAPAAPDPTRELARWLEALTYAVLALAGFAAVGVVVLLRIGGHLARIAER